MKPDKETAEHLREGQKLRELVKSDGWHIARGLLEDKLAVLDSISSLPTDMSFEEVGKQALYRAHAVSLIRSWLDEIEGRIEQDDQQAEALHEYTSETIVRQYNFST